MNEMLLSNSRRKGVYSIGIKKQKQKSPLDAGVLAAQSPQLSQSCHKADAVH